MVSTLALAVGVGWLPSWAGAVHLAALPPLDVAADLRLLLARAPSHPVFAVGLLFAIVVRGTVLALLLAGTGRPRWALALGFYAAAAFPALIAAQFDFVARTALYARAFGAALVVLTVTFLALAPFPWVPGPGTRRRFRQTLARGVRITDLLLYSGVVIALGALAHLAPTALLVPLVLLTGLATLTAASRLAAPPPRRPLVHVGVVLALVVAAAVAIVSTRGTPWPDPAPAVDGSAVIMSGVNSASGEGAIFELRVDRLGYDCDRVFYYSYAGPGDGQPRGEARCPITTGAPYEPEHTLRPFEDQVDLLEEQVRGRPEPTVVFAHSQAAWVAWEAAAVGRLEGVTRLVLVGPFPSSPTGFPPAGETGPGRYLSPVSQPSGSSVEPGPRPASNAPTASPTRRRSAPRR